MSRSNSDLRNKPEEWLRNRIREDLAKAGLELTPVLAEKIAGQFTELLGEYVAAPERSKDEVYERGERRILAVVHGLEANSPSRTV